MMKIAIATDNKVVAPHFGRCPSYTVVKIDNNQIKEKKVLDNPGHAPGAIPQFLDQLKVNVLITGGIGGRAEELFKQYKIGVISGVNGLVENVIGDYLTGVLKSGDSFCSPGGGKGYGIDKEECDHDENDHTH